MTRYDWFYLAALPALAPWLAWRRWVKGKYSESAAGMMGRRLPTGQAAEAYRDGSLWIHAVSVGEVAAARAVADGLRSLAPGLPLVVSTVTETGQAAARKAFPGDTVIYYPADLSSVVRRFQQTYRPKVFILMETELWPNFLMLAAERGTRCFMINAELSDRSFPRYLRMRGLLAPALGALEGVCAQTERYAERFAQLGIPRDRIRVTGNCKFDLDYPTLTEPERRDLAAQFGLGEGRRWIVAGSTHPGEEEMILSAFQAVLREVPEAGLLLCPRHPERFDEVAAQAAATGLRTGRASQPDPSADPQVVILDRMGVLAKSYGLGVAAIVAGSFCPVGGHNLLEAAAHRIPVIYGPDMHSQPQIQRLFSQAGAGLQIPAEALGSTLLNLLRDEPLRRQHGQRAHAVIEANRGSAARSVQAVGQWLNA